MKKLAIALILILASASPAAAQYPVVDIPAALRQENWPGEEGGGSCVHASMMSILRWQGQYAMAEWWGKTYDSGEYASRMALRMAQAGIPFCETTSGDPAFLDWCHKTRRGACIVVSGGRHMVNILHCDANYVCILDNNYPSKYTWYNRTAFIKYWQNSGGWAFTPYYSPAPPTPRR
jgi:hypothetical protein